MPVAYATLIEAIRLKLSRPLKARFDREFKAALAEPPTAASAVAAIQTAAAHRATGIRYVGQKTHEKQVLGYLDKAAHADFSQQQSADVCKAQLELGAIRPLRAFCKQAARRFPRAAIFPFLEAESYFAKGPEHVRDIWPAEPLLETANRLASEMPPGEQRTRLLEVIGARQELVRMLDLDPLGFFQEFVNRNGDFDEFADDSDDGDDW